VAAGANVKTKLTVTYDGFDAAKNDAVREALGTYETGSGFAFDTEQRDHTATVPNDDLQRVMNALKKISGINIQVNYGPA
jgi:uncharacterized protein (DUF2141 family)